MKTQKKKKKKKTVGQKFCKSGIRFKIVCYGNEISDQWKI